MNTQIVEAGFGAGGVVTVTLTTPGPAVEQSGHTGADAGRRVLSTALTSGIGASLQRAGELLAVVRAAARADTAQKKRLAAIDKQAVEAASLLFGANLDDRLKKLDREREEVVAVAGSDFRREKSMTELRGIRDTVMSGGVAAVANTVAERLKTAAVEREQVAERLTAVMEKELARLIALDAELHELRQVTAEEEVKNHLEDVLPAVFGEDGLMPHTVYDWREEKAARDEESERRGWNDRPAPLSLDDREVERWED